MIIHVDPARCTGCRACEVFCSLEQEGKANPALSRIQVLKDVPHDFFLPVVCPPCEDKACLTACREPGALVIDPVTGAVVLVDALCSGCSRCVSACDIGAIRLLRLAGRGKKGKAAVIKCNQCGGDPWCVRVCEPGALTYVPETPERTGQQVFERLRAMRAEIEPVLADRGLKPRRRIKTP